ncbi:MAG: serine hydrolase [Luteimonas sp.]
MFRSNRRFAGLLAGTLFAVSGAVGAMDDAALGEVLDRRLLGDSTGACIAAAVIEDDNVARAWRCADPADVDRIGPDVAFEIGSITKTMTAILLADLILGGGASLDDPLADHLPEGTAVPEHEGQPILLRHVVTHVSGLPRLPSRLELTNPEDPYATFDADALLASLQDVALAQAPGEVFEYSNFGAMLVSLAVARHSGMDFERLLDEKLFTPLRMENAHIANRPDGLRMAAGHLPNGQETPPWTFAGDLAGVGGVRATLDDMVRYAQAQFGGVQGVLGEAIDLAQQPIPTAADQAMAMNWLLMPVGDRMVHAHDGGTGGFSSMLAFDLERGRAAVVLADTGLAAMGGVNDVAAHLLDDSIPLSEPRRPVERPEVAPAPAPAPEALREYAGSYPLMPGLELVVREHDGVLHAQATGQGEFPLEPVADDVFEAANYDIEISFSRNAAGEVTKLDLRQGGHLLSGERQ